MAKKEEALFRSMDEIDVQHEIMGAGAGIAGGVAGAYGMTHGLNKWTRKMKVKWGTVGTYTGPLNNEGKAVNFAAGEWFVADDSSNGKEIDVPIVQPKYRPLAGLFVGLLGRVFVRNDYGASFFQGITTIAGTAELAQLTGMGDSYGMDTSHGVGFRYDASGALLKADNGDVVLLSGLGAYYEQPTQQREVNANYNPYENFEEAQQMALAMQNAANEAQNTPVKGVEDTTEEEHDSVQ